MKTRHILAAFAASLLLTGCFQDVHEINPAADVGYVASGLQWENPADAGTEIHDLLVVVNGPGVSFTKEYANPAEFASEPLDVPPGQYELLALANMSDADGYVLSGLPATKAVAGPVTVSLKKPGGAQNQSWFGPSTVTVEQDAVTTAKASLQRLLTTITLDFINVPSGAVLTITLTGVASSVILNEKDANGHYGVPAGESTNYVLGTLTGSGKQTFYCFPTVSGQQRVILSVEVTPPGEPPYTCVCEVPAVSCGKEYTLQLDYNKLSTYMYVTSHTINEWTEGWTYNGRVY